jgi:hypothetical protein
MLRKMKLMPPVPADRRAVELTNAGHTAKSRSFGLPLRRAYHHPRIRMPVSQAVKLDGLSVLFCRLRSLSTPLGLIRVILRDKRCVPALTRRNGNFYFFASLAACKLRRTEAARLGISECGASSYAPAKEPVQPPARKPAHTLTECAFTSTAVMTVRVAVMAAITQRCSTRPCHEIPVAVRVNRPLSDWHLGSSSGLKPASGLWT